MIRRSAEEWQHLIGVCQTSCRDVPILQLQFQSYLQHDLDVLCRPDPSCRFGRSIALDF